MDEVILHPFDDRIEVTLGLIEGILGVLLSSTLVNQLDSGQQLMLGSAKKNLAQIVEEL